MGQSVTPSLFHDARLDDRSFPSMANTDLASCWRAMASAPTHLRDAVSGLSGKSVMLLSISRPGKWSVVEIALLWRLGGGRRWGIRLAWAQSGSNFVGYDQDRWSAALDYQDSRFGPARRVPTCSSAPASHTQHFSNGSPDDCCSGGHDPEYGPITLRNLFELYSDQGERHLGQILALRSLLRSATGPSRPASLSTLY